MHAYMHTLVSLFSFGVHVRRASAITYQVPGSCEVYSVVFYGHSSSMVFVCTTPRQGGLRFGTARQFRGEQAVPRGRSRILKAVKRRVGWQSKYSYWRPRRGETNEAY